jgi:hypothetical protein
LILGSLMLFASVNWFFFLKKIQQMGVECTGKVKRISQTTKGIKPL